MSDADVKMPEPDPALKDVALLLNRLILMSSAKAQQEPGEPPQDRITDADIDGLEADVLEAVRAAVLAERERKLAHNVLAMADAVRGAYDDCATVATSEDPRTFDWVYDDYNVLADALRKRGKEAVAHLEGMVARETARPLSEYHEDFGAVLWWQFPVNEPPYVGSPLCNDWPGYHTHWTPLPPVPKEPEDRAAAIRKGTP